MDKLKERFKNDPQFAAAVILGGAAVTATILNAVSKNIQAVAYAQRAAVYASKN